MSKLRANTIRLASQMPKGSQERKALLNVLAMTHRDQKTPADMIAYLKEHGIFQAGGDIVRIDGDLTYEAQVVKPYRRTGIKITGKESMGYGSYESWEIIITPRKATIKTKMVEDDYVDEDVNTIRTIQIVGAP